MRNNAALFNLDSIDPKAIRDSLTPEPANVASRIDNRDYRRNYQEANTRATK